MLAAIDLQRGNNVYITNVLMQAKDEATNIIHLFGFVNYFIPIIGAWVSDRVLGRYSRSRGRSRPRGSRR